MEKPNIYLFKDYRKYLKSMLEFLKNSPRRKSLRQIAKSINISPSYLSMIINGQRKLDLEWLDKISEIIYLTEQEKNYLKNLIKLNDGKVEEKHDSFKKMAKFKTIKEKNKHDIEIYKYLTKWYCVAIREMATLPDFIADPNWIQKRLIKNIPLKDIKEALDFLISHHFIEVDQNLKCTNKFKRIDATQEVYKLALSGFHKELLSQAAESIYEVPSQNRLILGHTISLNKPDFDLAKEILDQALQKIQQLGQNKNLEPEVYHISFTACPITINKGVKDEE
jgi:uncharacterized protein (TIGR02147 family)